MIAGPRRIAALALALSVGAHLAGFGVLGAPEGIEIQGGAPQTVAMLGDSLADLVPTTTQPVTQDDTLTPTVTEPAAAQPVTPQRVVPENTAQVPLTPAARPDEVAALPAGTATDPAEMRKLDPVQPAPDRITATTPVEVRQPDADTPRPKTRPDPKVAKKAPPKPKPAKAAEPARQKAKQATTNSTATARKGQADGKTNAQAARSSATAGAARAAGNAAVSNYPGKVMRKIQRTRKERSGGRGTAKVGFRVTASGAVASVRILKSSGSPRVDQNALRHVQRAAPFPPPPQGAQTSFSIDFVSKG
ncbi:energy transducer TonB [Actibacterium ureilyticum]|uniref:energy transducer TonB n=1 Tax=Actibacterium ureilyticum TaxID=1590614 RepID=UPI000BAAA226|nr:TonB family protein [Actibacterium ureilyticum]